MTLLHTLGVFAVLFAILSPSRGFWGQPRCLSGVNLHKFMEPTKYLWTTNGSTDDLNEPVIPFVEMYDHIQTRSADTVRFERTFTTVTPPREEYGTIYQNVAKKKEKSTTQVEARFIDNDEGPTMMLFQWPPSTLQVQLSECGIKACAIMGINQIGGIWRLETLVYQGRNEWCGVFFIASFSDDKKKRLETGPLKEKWYTVMGPRKIPELGKYGIGNTDCHLRVEGTREKPNPLTECDSAFKKICESNPFATPSVTVTDETPEEFGELAEKYWRKNYKTG